MGIQTVKSTAGYGSNPAGRPSEDFYRTPRIAVDKLLEVEEFDGPILEPAAGDGAISKVLEEYGHEVDSWELYDYGYGKTGIDFTKIELRDGVDWEPEDLIHPYSAIITNPPFKYAQEFIEKGLKLTWPYDGKLALLLRLSFLEGQKRRKLFEDSPLKKVYVFSKRLTFTRPGDEGKDYSGMMAYAWYVWDWNYFGEPQIGWI